jgi:hypothetical protein
MSSLSLPDLAKQLASLTDAQALDLLSSIEGLTARAAAHKAAMAAAEAQRDAWATKIVCGCGKPATVARYVRWEEARIRPGIATWLPTGPTGGIVAHDSDYESPPSSRDEDLKRFSGDLWAHCTEKDCDHAWTRVLGGYAAIVEWE